MKDKEWGERLVCIFSWKHEISIKDQTSYTEVMKMLVMDWQPAEKPIAWYYCSNLSPNEAGKWQRSKWQKWLKDNYNSVITTKN